VTPDERKTLITQYNDGYRVVAEALAGATDEQLDARPAPGKWTAREVVHHLADSEMTAASRLRLLVATDRPQILGYDQDQFAQRLPLRKEGFVLRKGAHSCRACNFEAFAL